MKTIIPQLLILFVICQVNAQQSNELPKPSNTNSVICTANTFYGLTGSNEVISLTLNGSTVTNNGVIATSPNQINSLAIGSDLINGSSQNIFYSSSADSIVYHDGTNWQNTIFAPTQYHNGGGSRGFIFYQANTFPSEIVRFDGTSLTTILLDSSLLFTVADIAVSDNRNVFYFSGSGATTLFMHEISSTGTLVNTYNLNLNTGNGYGCFIMNNIIYIALVPGGTPANSLIPITISGAAATTGTPVSMPNIIIKDLAGCSGESSTGIFSIPSFDPNIIIYPNPAAEIVHIEISGSKKGLIRIMDASGRLAFEKLIENCEESINIHDFKAGFYFIQAVINDKTIYKSFQRL